MRTVAYVLLAIVSLTPGLALADAPGPFLNSYRAYPASCLTLPLPEPSGPIFQARVTLPTVNSSFQQVGTEAVTFEFWRSPCNGGSSALLGHAVRDTSLQNTSPYPVFEGIFVSQGSISNYPVRLVEEPNTAVSYIPSNQLIIAETDFVFENDAAAIFDYSNSINIEIAGVSNVAGSIPAYDRTQYSNSGLPMQISGYQTGNYSDPSGGQGIQVEVSELGSSSQRTIVIAWYTYDDSGTSYWLFNSTTFNVGARSVSLPLGYFTGGRFAGNGGSTTASQWGTVTLSFPDCSHMLMTYNALVGLPQGVPVGSGTRTFTRITSINGLTCDSP